MPTPNRFVRVLGIAAVAMGLGAAFAGSPFLARRDVTAIELAGWIKDRRPALRVIDTRTLQEFDAYHVPGGEHVSIDSLAAMNFRTDETIVVYSEGAADARALKAVGRNRVLFLRGGLYEWLDRVMNPTLSVGASAKDSAAFSSVAALSRYFGGSPVRGADAEPRLAGEKSATTLTQKVRRRGC